MSRYAALPILRRGLTDDRHWARTIGSARSIELGGENTEAKDKIAAIRPRAVRPQKASYTTHSGLGDPSAKVLENKDFPMVGAAGLEPRTR